MLHRSIPHERFEPTVCTWHCHNHGCRHRPRLPSFLTGDRGAFGLTIATLGALGHRLSAHPGRGYGLANLAVFCVGWPLVTLALWRKALSLGEEARALEARLRRP